MTGSDDLSAPSPRPESTQARSINDAAYRTVWSANQELSRHGTGMAGAANGVTATPGRKCDMPCPPSVTTEQAR